jgi:uncharacterized damage-inducible protein DinB
MKKLTFYALIVVVAISTVAFVNTKNTTVENEKADDYFLEFLEESKSYTIELAEAMPADKYTFKPHDSVRSFGEQMAHIGMSSKFLLGAFVKEEPFPTDPNVFAEIGKMEKEMGTNKEECIKTINATFEYIENTYKSMDEAALKETFTVPFDPAQPKFTKSKAFDFIKEHIIHHRSQALVSLRMQGIKAPTYRLY